MAGTEQLRRCLEALQGLLQLGHRGGVTATSDDIGELLSPTDARRTGQS